MRKKERKTDVSVLETEHDISSMDPALFEDPVLLLEYLQGLDSGGTSIPSEMQSQKSSNPYEEKPISNNAKLKKASDPKLLYGYELIHGEVKINQEQAEAIVTIIYLHDVGYSTFQIEYLLGDTKHRTVTGKKFYPGAIHTIIKNRKVYEGETGYPPILKAGQKHSQGQKIVMQNQTNMGASQQSSQRMKNNNHLTSYWDALDKMRRDIEQRKQSGGKKKNDSERIEYRNIDEFLTYIKSKGVPVKDSRRNDGCVWVRADVAVADIMAHVVINGCGFRYAQKCKAFNGGPGWYY